MNPRIQHLIKNPFETGIDDVALLQDEIEKFPYFSTLRTLLLFGLKESEHESFQEELKKTSIHSPSRVALYHYLQKEKQTSETLETAESIPEKSEIKISNQKMKVEAKVEIFEEAENIAATEIEKKDVSHKEFTFSEWLTISKTDAEKSEKQPSEKEIKFRLIDDFIEKSPKISPPSKSEAILVSAVKPQNHEYSDLMTETLAQIYTEQKKFDKALRAYKILLLKYPEKSEIFSDKIQEIENLMNQNN